MVVYVGPSGRMYYGLGFHGLGTYSVHTFQRFANPRNVSNSRRDLLIQWDRVDCGAFPGRCAHIVYTLAQKSCKYFTV